MEFISLIKYQTDSIIEREGRCPYNTTCSSCYYLHLCRYVSPISNEKVLSLAKKVKENNYNIDAVLFEEVL